MVAPKITLKQQAIYRSITNLPETQLPNLTVLTGVNGSGKSHLLEAIVTGKVSVDIAPNHLTDIRLFTWANMVPQDVGATNVSQIHSNRDWFVAQSRNFRSQFYQNIIDLVQKYGLTDFAADPWRLFSIGEDEAVARLGHAQIYATFLRELDNIENNIRANIENQARGDELRKTIMDDLNRKKVQFSTLTFKRYDDITGGRYGLDMFQQSFGDLFFAYFDRLRDNRLRRMDESESRKPEEPSLSDEEFTSKYGAPPWDFVNNMFAEAKLDFQIDYPKDYSSTEYIPRLTKISTKTPVPFGALSSGEKILMSFAFCLYNSADKRQNIQRPKLILFDEIDAPLHPSMSKTLMHITKSVLVEKEDISIILVTHSPSTVAVSPNESVHLLEPVTNRITAESKRRAVSSLTSDIPTMSIDFSGRRQVFVESTYDAERYALLYQIFAPQIESERSLNFIGVGYGNMDTGSAAVKAVVQSLSDGGNSSVLGLIDWDTTNIGDDRVLVLGDGSRYAIESYLLDPLLVASALLHDDPKSWSELSLPASATFVTFSKLSDEELQAATSVVQNRVLARLGLTAEPEFVDCSYIGGKVLSLNKHYLLANGHDLELAVQKEFDVFKKHHRTGDFLKHMVNTVIRNYPALTPAELLGSLKKLCDQNLDVD